MSPRIHRRLFLQGGFAALGSSLLASRTPFAAVFGPRRPGGRPLTDDNGARLVVVQLRGANDGLNTVVPYAQSAYRSLRPTLALAEETLLPLDGDLAFNPALAPLMPWWESGRMAVVENVGYPNPDLSHFRSEAIWYAADPVAAAGDGWLGGWMASRPAPSPLELTTVGIVPSPATAAASYVPAAVRDPHAFGWDLTGRFPEDAALREALLHEGFAAAAAAGGLSSDLAATGLAAESIVAEVGSLPPEDEPPVAYPPSPLAGDLGTAARLLAGGLPVRVAWVTTGGFDTHAEQADTHRQLWEGVASALAAFLEDLEVRGLSGRTVVLVWTEFGRRPRENASGGTDHGTAGPVFLLGDPVKGGLTGSAPDLGSLDANGNLVYDIDFRSVYETVLAEHLGVDPRLVLPEPWERLGLFH